MFTSATYQILILVEASGKANGSGNQAIWRYGFARMSSFNLRVDQDEKNIYIKPRAPVPTLDATSPYFFRMRAELDRSDELQDPETPKAPN